jgi:hypothetical protein
MDVITRPEALRGFSVRAQDGRVGVVGDASPGALVVKRAFRRRISIPGRAVVRIDFEGRTVFIDRTHRQVSRTRPGTDATTDAWFIPASNQVPGAANRVIGTHPAHDDGERESR